MKVLLINNYPMDRAYELWKNGEYPSQHLWGKIEMDREKKVEIIILKHEKYKFLNTIGNLIKIKYLDQQIRTLFILRKIDIIYSPYATANTKLLILLKLLGLLSKPIVILAHQPLFGFKSRSRIKKFIARKLILKYDSVVFLGRGLRDDFIQGLHIPEAIAEKKFLHADWGADTVFYNDYTVPKLPSETDFAVSAGKTDRDFETVIEAFREINFNLKIYCSPESAPHNKDIPKNVTICTSGISYTDLLKEYNNARVILIPLKRHRGGTQGQTSLIDVFAMGKPLVMTYNKNIDFDLEKEGIGYWVEQDSVNGWKEAINNILKDEKSSAEMGARSMRIYKERCNSEIFAKQMTDIFEEIHKRAKSE